MPEHTEPSHRTVALITGGGSGLGAATAVALAESGYAVIVADIRIGAAERIADELRAGGGEAVAMSLDAADERASATAVEETVERYGSLDILVNSAGVDVTAPADELAVSEWDRVIGVNLRAPYLMSRAALPVMRAQGRGHIVNIVSTAAKRAWPNAAAYHASKWGLLGLSHALHAEARAYGVKVTAVVAGGMRTPFLFDRFPEIDPAVLQDPRDVADTIRFVLQQPADTVIPEITVIPMRETSWP